MPDPEEIAEYERADAADHDGIGEEDNDIPRWWWIGFGFTVVWAFVYMPYYLFSGWSQETMYAAEVEAAASRIEASRPEVPSENPFPASKAVLAEGKDTFLTICAACHKPDGSGLVGPSLVDPYWKYGHSDADMYESVAHGRPGGMPPWEAQLGQDKIWKVIAYVRSLPQSDEPGVGAPADAGGAGDAPAGAAGS